MTASTASAPSRRIPVWLQSRTQVGPNRYECRWVTYPVDDLDAEYDGIALRGLLTIDARARSENVVAQCARRSMTPLQRSVIAAHWSAELRDRVNRTAAADASRRPSVLVDLEDD